MQTHRAVKVQTRAKVTLTPAEAAALPKKVGQASPAAATYTNDRRAGRTKPGVIEMIEVKDPRHPNHPAERPVNRAYRRSLGQRGSTAAPGSNPRHPLPRAVRRAMARRGERVPAVMAHVAEYVGGAL